MAGVPSTDTRFRTLFDMHHPSVHAYCLRRLPVDDANEAASEVFLVAWRRIGDLPDDDEALMWLYGVARNVVRNHRRSTWRHLRLAARTGSMATASAEGPETQVIRNEEYDEVLSAVGSLKETERELLSLKVWEGLSNEAIGTVLGISDRAVEGRYARAITKLSKQLDRGQPAAQRSPFSDERGDIAI